MAMNIEQKKDDAEIPTASMADIAFLLIVFFMLTTVFSANKGMEHVLPPKDDVDDAIEPDEAIYIEVFPDGQFEMDKENYSMDRVDQVYTYVNNKLQQNQRKPIIVHTNREAKYGDMVLVLNQLKLLSAHLERELAITIPNKEEAQRYSEYNQ